MNSESNECLYTFRSPGYPSHPQTHLGPPSANSGEEQGSVGQSPYSQFGNMTFGQIPPLAFLPLQLSGTNFPSRERLGNNLTTSQSLVEAEKQFLENQIEVWKVQWFTKFPLFFSVAPIFLYFTCSQTVHIDEFYALIGTWPFHLSLWPQG